jgi:hypothetical protein
VLSSYGSSEFSLYSVPHRVCGLLLLLLLCFIRAHERALVPLGGEPLVDGAHDVVLVLGLKHSPARGGEREVLEVAVQVQFEDANFEKPVFFFVFVGSRVETRCCQAMDSTLV